MNGKSIPSLRSHQTNVKLVLMNFLGWSLLNCGTVKIAPVSFCTFQSSLALTDVGGNLQFTGVLRPIVEKYCIGCSRNLGNRT